MKKWFVGLAMAIALLWCGSALAQPYTPCTGNKIANWNLEADPGFAPTGPGTGNPPGQIGNFTSAGFTTDYTVMDPLNTGGWALGQPQYLTISSNPPSAYHSAWATFGDHTTGSGQMMIINASADPGKVIWKQAVTGLTPFQTYLFSYHVALSYAGAPPHLTVYINDTFVGEYDTGTSTPNGVVGQWAKVDSIPYYAWTDTAEIKIIDTTEEYSGDDFALDDFEMCVTGQLPPDGPTVCAETDLVRGRTHIDTGDVEVTRNEDGSMDVTYVVDAPWCFTELHLDIENDPALFPQKNGNAIPGKFEYKYDPTGCHDTYTFNIPVEEIPTGDQICVAAHAALKKPQTCYDNGVPYPCPQTATGWGLGTDFTGSNWSMYFCFPADECRIPNTLSLRCDEGDSSFAYNAMPFGVVNCAPPSQAFEATATNEFGDEVRFDAAGKELVSLSVAFNSYGCSDSGSWYQGVTNPCVTTPGENFTVPITANIYDPSDLSIPLASVTQNETIEFRPSADSVNCGGIDPNGYESGSRFWNPDGNGGTGACQYSLVKVLTFGFPSGTILPQNVVWSVAFNTSHSGKNPIGEDPACFGINGGCGYDSLNVGVKSFANAPYSGADLVEDMVFHGFWNGGYPAPWGSGVLVPIQPENGWTGFRPLAAIRTK